MWPKATFQKKTRQAHQKSEEALANTTQSPNKERDKKKSEGASRKQHKPQQ